MMPTNEQLFDLVKSNQLRLDGMDLGLDDIIKGQTRLRESIDRLYAHISDVALQLNRIEIKLSQ